MVRKKRNSYSPRQKVAYHSSRIDNPNVNERKQMYSRSWLDGYSDSRVRENAGAFRREFEARRRNRMKIRDYDISLLAADRGQRVRLTELKK